MYWLIGIIALFIMIFYFYFGNYAMTLFYQCMKHDVRISYWELAMMKHRGAPINDFLVNAIKLKEKGIDVKIKDFELHMKSGGRVSNVVNILLNAKKAKIDMTYHEAAIKDLDEVNRKKKIEEAAKNNVATKQTEAANSQAEEATDQPQETQETANNLEEAKENTVDTKSEA